MTHDELNRIGLLLNCGGKGGKPGPCKVGGKSGGGGKSPPKGYGPTESRGVHELKAGDRVDMGNHINRVVGSPVPHLGGVRVHYEIGGPILYGKSDKVRSQRKLV